MDSGDQQAQPVFTRVIRQRDPKPFSGLREKDAEDWLANYKWVSDFDRWGDHSKLRNVIFYLKDVARVWFANHEEEITSWQIFTTNLSATFGRPVDRRAAAERKLVVRVQTPGETHTSYIEDVLALCRRANSEMHETERMRHLLKSVSEEAFQALLVPDLMTVKDVTKCCQRLQEARNFRIRLPPLRDNLLSNERTSMDSFRTLIQEIVREELPKTRHFSATLPPDADTNCIRRIVQYELTATSPSGSTFRSDHPSSKNEDNYLQPSNFNVMPTTILQLPLASVTWAPVRLPDNAWGRDQPSRRNSWNFGQRPTCYYCGILGHVFRLCHRRREDMGVPKLREAVQENIADERTWNHQILKTGLPVNRFTVFDLHLPSTAPHRVTVALLLL